MVDYALLEQRLRAGVPLEAYGIHGYYTSEKHDLIIPANQSLSFTGLFDPVRGYNCGQINALLCRILQEEGRDPCFVVGREKTGIFSKHYFCIDDTVQLDGTPLFPFVQPDHIFVEQKKEMPRGFQPEINSPLGVYQEEGERYLLFLRAPQRSNRTEMLSYDFLIRSIDTPFWIKYKTQVDISKYKRVVQHDCLPYTSLPLSVALITFLKKNSVITTALIGHEELGNKKNRTRLTTFQRAKERYADAEIGLIHKVAWNHLNYSKRSK